MKIRFSNNFVCLLCNYFLGES